MNQRVREAVDALRVLDEHERLTALQAVTKGVKTSAQKHGIRAMWLVREEKRKAESSKLKSGSESGSKAPRERKRRVPAGAEKNPHDFGLPGGDGGGGE